MLEAWSSIPSTTKEKQIILFSSALFLIATSSYSSKYSRAVVIHASIEQTLTERLLCASVS
jgi:hypothetical protein